MVAQEYDIAQLMKRGDFFKNLIEMSPDGILVHSKGRFIFSNPAGLKLLGGKTFEEIEKRSVIDFVHPDYREAVLKRISNLEDEQIDVPPSIEKLIKLDGTVICAEVSGRPIKFKDINANLLVVRDVTQELEDKERLAESELRKTAILKAIPDLVFIIDSQGIFRDFNIPADIQMYLPRPEIIGTKLEEILPENVLKEYMAKIHATLMTKKTNFLEYEYQIPNSIQTYEARFIYYQKDQVMAITRNITRKRAEEEEQQRTKKLESIGFLAGGIAHDFNNILAKILGNANLAKLEDDTPDEVLKFLNEIEHATLQAKKLTQQLLTFSKGGEPITKVESIKGLLEESISLFLSGSKSKVITNYSIEQMNVEVEAGQIEQVISNLIINADQSMPEGGLIEINVDNIQINDDNNNNGMITGKYVRIEITDHGMGIAEENKKRIFEPYFTTKKDGSGLGLTTSYSIVKRHHGYIQVESMEGKGSSFTVYLPTTEKKLIENQLGKQNKMFFSGKVLIMDDSVDIQQMLGKMLKKLGFTVEIANNGEEAIAKYKMAIDKKSPFSLVIIDLTIPGGIGGKATLEQILQIDANAKAIVSSGYSNDPIMAKYREFGFSGILPKPYTIKELRNVISTII